MNFFSSTELESGNAPEAFLQTPALVLHNISGPAGQDLYAVLACSLHPHRESTTPPSTHAPN